MAYAEKSSVSPGRSREDIERVLGRYGARGFMSGYDDDHGMAMVMFKHQGHQIRFLLPLPSREEFVRTPSGRQKRTPAQQEAAYDQATRQKWRALFLVIKAKLESVESGIVSFDEEFGMHFVLPNNRTVHEWIGPVIQEAEQSGDMPRSLPGFTTSKAIGE